MKKQVQATIVIIVASLTTLYISGYIAQFLINYHEWQLTGGDIGAEITPLFPSATITKCFESLFTFPYGLYGILVSIIAFVVIIFMMMHMGGGDKGVKDERNFILSEKGTYGTSGYMEISDIEKLFEMHTNPKHTRGIILGTINGKTISLPQDTYYNRNIAIYGSSGSMKSRAYIRNLIFQSIKMGQSLIITDPKSELYRDMSTYLNEHGYIVRVFNLIHPENSDAWDLLGEVNGEEIRAQVLSDTIIKNTGGGKEDHFWNNAELNLLKALVLYVDKNYPDNQKAFGEVYQLLMHSEPELNTIFDVLPFGHPAKGPYSLFKQASESVRSGVIIGLGTRLQVFQNNLIKKITKYNEIDLELPGRQKCAYFCVISDQDSTFDFLSSLFFSFLFIDLIRFADKQPDGRLPVPVHIVGDEWPNIGTVPDFCKKISTIRSRDFSISIAFQNLPQLQNRYPDNQWLEILGNCDTTLFLGATDPLTANFISDRSGDISIQVKSQGKQLNTWRVSDYSPQYRETASIGKRKLLTPDEVLRLPIDEGLVILRGEKIFKITKFDYTKHPEYKHLPPPSDAIKHIPKWKEQKNKSVQPDSSVVHKKETEIKPKSKAIVSADKKSILS